MSGLELVRARIELLKEHLYKYPEGILVEQALNFIECLKEIEEKLIKEKEGQCLKKNNSET